MALLEAQKENAKNGDENTEGILANLMLGITTSQEKSLKQIAMQEAIPIVSKLTSKQINMLTVNYLLREKLSYAGTEGGLKHMFSYWLKPFIFEKEEWKSPNLPHLISTGCLRASHEYEYDKFSGVEYELPRAFPSLFASGFSLNEFQEKFGTDERLLTMLIPFKHDETKFQFDAHNEYDLRTKYLNELALDPTEARQIVGFLNSHTIPAHEVIRHVKSIDEESAFIFESWTSQLFKYRLTPIGVAIAITNMLNKLGFHFMWPSEMERE